MSELAALEARFQALKGANLALDLTRGKPAADQLDLADALDGMLEGNYRAEDGTDARNYGNLRGLPEARALGTRFLDVEPDEVMAGGNASLTIMFFVLDAAMNADLAGPSWRESGPVKALCPVPGYDRHFTVADAVGMELVNVAITEDGPDMDAVEDLVANDPAVRCIWCVPKYSNPTGCIYSPETVRRLAALPGKTERPFLVLWDNAYAVARLRISVEAANTDPAAGKSGRDSRQHCDVRFYLQGHLLRQRDRVPRRFRTISWTRWRSVCRRS